jgi:hypothetical protein
MGLLSGTSTVTVNAFLTNAGKRKIFNAIQDGDASGFITKFCLGDSDSNYASIEAGNGVLGSGHVPEASDYMPSLRSYALFSGQYRPGKPVILIGEDYGPEINLDMSVGSNNEKIFINFAVNTEWPKNSSFKESTKLVSTKPSWMSQAVFDRLFTLAPLPNGTWAFQFNGGATEDELDALLGVSRTGSSTITLNAIGSITNQTAVIYVEIRQ